MSPKYKNYSVINYLAFNYAGFACVAIIVFLSSTQPFFIKEIIGIDPTTATTSTTSTSKNSKDGKIGHIVGGLGFIDELTAMIVAPLLGALNDNLNSKQYNGSKLIQSFSFIIIAISLFGYAVWCKNLVPDMFIFRSIFAIGVTGCMSMVTVILNELTISDFEFWRSNKQVTSQYIPLNQEEEGEDADEQQQHTSPDTLKKNGKFAGLMGVCTGLGAIFSVSVFVTLPINLGMKNAYLVVMGFALLSFAILFSFLYNVNGKDNIHNNENDNNDNNNNDNNNNEISAKNESYFQLLIHGYEFSKHNKQAQLAYAGSFVARSTTVATAMFIPLMVYEWYYTIGQCKSNNDNEWAGKLTCHEGYVFAAILSGVAQTVALISAPIWGYFVDARRIGKCNTLALAAIVGMIGNFGLSLIHSYSSNTYNPKTFICFFMISIIGLSQIGLIISSMSVLSGIPNAHDIMGSLSGLYSFCGGIGIMIISSLGGYLSDHWILGPFFILGLFNVALLVIYYSYSRQQKSGNLVV